MRIVSRGGRRTSRERGVAVVELALVAPLLLTILLGIIEYGFVFNNTIELRSAAREGARVAAVDNQCEPPAGCSGNSAQTQLDNIVTATTAKISGLAHANNALVTVSCTSNAGVSEACLGAAPGDYVQVCINYTYHSVTGFFAPFVDGKILRGKGVLRLEQSPTFSSGNPTGQTGTASC